MTTRAAALTVILEGMPREDDIEGLIAAIRRMRGVADVQIIEHSGDMVIAEARTKVELRKRIMDALWEILT